MLKFVLCMCMKSAC